MDIYTTKEKMIDAVAETTTSNGYNVSDRHKLSIDLSSTSTNGVGSFQCEVSNDYITWTPYRRMNENLTNTITESDTRTDTIIVTAPATKSYVFFPDGDHFKMIRGTMYVYGGGQNIQITDPGTNYLVGNTLSDLGGFEIEVDSVDNNDGIETFTVTSAGSGYQIGGVLTMTGGDGSGFACIIDELDNDGNYTAILHSVANQED